LNNGDIFNYLCDNVLSTGFILINFVVLSILRVENSLIECEKNVYRLTSDILIGTYWLLHIIQKTFKIAFILNIFVKNSINCVSRYITHKVSST